MRARVLTALALIPPVLATLFCTSPGPLLLVCLLLIVLASSEIGKMVRGSSARVLTGSLVLGAAGFFFAALAGSLSSPHLALLAGWGAFAFLLGVLSVWAAVRGGSSRLAQFGGGGWVAGPLVALAALHWSMPTPPLWRFDPITLLAIVPLWAGDTAAIFAGKAFGKHPLAPSISPKKTVEGGIANLSACVLAAWGLGAWIGVPVVQSLACGFAAGILGQAGDLFESWVKRKADLKDSGTILPGHGGIMDRIDSILFTVPVVALILLGIRAL